MSPRTSLTSSSASSINPCTLGAAFRQSLQLAAEGATDSYLHLAESILQGPEAAQKLAAAAATPGFSQALTRQGLELSELHPSTSRLTIKRRVDLLAAVLQESESLRGSWTHGQKSSPRVVAERIQVQFALAVEHQQRTWEQMRAVVQRNNEIEQEQLAVREEKVLAKEEQLRCFRAGQEEAAEERRLQALEREELRHRTMERAEELEATRVREREAFLADRERSLGRSLSQREEEHQGQRERLRQRFQQVQEANEAARRDKEAQVEALEERHSEAMRRSEELVEALQQDLQQRQDGKRERRQEKEHQVLRVQRMHEARRFILVTETEEDRTAFAKTLPLRSSLQKELSSLASRLDMGGEVLSESSKAAVRSGRPLGSAGAAGSPRRGASPVYGGQLCLQSAVVAAAAAGTGPPGALALTDAA